ncbi:endonuclease/exonuclease/phosphatase family protein [Cupriavidus basilensis]
MKLRVVTYNIHKGVTGISTPAAHPRFPCALGLQAMDADIVFLQEVQDRNDRLVAAAACSIPTTPSSITWPRDAYPHSVYGRNAVYEHGHHGNAILSRHPILMSENHRHLRPSLRAAGAAARGGRRERHWKPT